MYLLARKLFFFRDNAKVFRSISASVNNFVTLYYLIIDVRRWYTPIHEARDACEQQLIDFKKEVESLDEQRKRLKRLQKKKKTGREDAENPEEGQETDNEQEDSNETMDQNVSDKVGCSRIKAMFY